MDVMKQYLAGHQAGQAEVQHQQAMEENSLRMKILKHQIDGLKIEDAVRQRALAAQNLSLMNGQPEAQMPTEPVEQQNLQPSQSYAGGMTGLPGMVSGMVRDEMGLPGPGTIAAPNAQETTPGTNMTTKRASVKFNAVPGMVGEVNVQPKSAEEMVRAQVQADLMKPHTVSTGQKLVVGGRVVAEGGKAAPTRASIATAAAGGDADAIKANDLMRNQTASSGQQVDKLLDGEQTTLIFDPKTKKYSDLDGNDIKDAATRVKPLRGTSADPGVAAKRTNDDLRASYNEFYNVYNKTHPAPTATERAMALASGDTLNAVRPPPSIDKWKVMTPAERQKVLSEPDSRITDAEMMRRTNEAAKVKGTKTADPTPAASGSVPANVATFFKAQAPPAEGKIKHYKLTDGSEWDLYPDGTVQPGSAQ